MREGAAVHDDVHIFPWYDTFNVDYGEAVDGALCAETGSGTGIFRREYTKSMVEMDCNTWQANITMKQ